MIFPSNLPSRIPRIFAFKDQNLDIKFLFPDGYDVSGITAKAFYKDKYHNGLISITTSGQLVTATITKEDFLTVDLPVFDIYIYRNGIGLLGATIQIENKSGIPNTQTFNVTIVDGFVVNVDVNDANAVIDAAERAETAADLASELAIQVSQDKQSVSSDKADVMEAKDEVVGIISNPRPDTFAEMLLLCLPGKPKRFTVVTDTDGSPNVPYYWDGVILLFYGLTPADIQPTI